MGTRGDSTEESAGPLAFLGLQRKGSREEEKKDEDMEVEKEGKEDEVFDTENGDGDQNGTNDKNDNGNTEEEGMDVEEGSQDGKNEGSDEQKQPKEAGSVLFGTLFKYMDEKIEDASNKSDKEGKGQEDSSTNQDGNKDQEC